MKKRFGKTNMKNEEEEEEEEEKKSRVQNNHGQMSMLMHDKIFLFHCMLF